MTPPVRLYADRALVPPGAPYMALLAPLWGRGDDKYADERSPTSRALAGWERSGREVLELAPLESAEVAVLPLGWEHVARHPEREAAARAYAERVAAAGVPLVVFHVADSSEPVPLPGAHVFRTSADRGRLGPREHVLPAFATDLVEELGGRVEPRPWRPRPVVGFCGYAPDAGPLGRARGLARRLARRRAHPAAMRTHACRALRRSPRVRTRFVLRTAYWAGAVRSDGSLDYAAMREARAQFLRNVAESDYVLAVRGGGNFSIRLYEALSCGRVPVYVDTGAPLPLEDELDWDELVVRVPEADVSRLGPVVADAHARLGPDGFAERQRACRRAWVERLSPEAYLRALAPVLRALDP